MIPDGDTLAWLGGTAFAVVQNHTRRPQDAALVAGRISDALAGTFRLGRQEVRVGASVGIACYPDDGTAAAELLRRADLALDQARQAGHRSIRFFAPRLDGAVARRRALERDLRLAPERQQLHVAYQPLVDLATRRVVGVEALLRWRRPAHGLVPPDEFIPVAEASGMIRSLGAWVLDEACAQARAWRDQGLGLQVAVNVSPAQLQLGFGELVAEVLARHALPPGQLCLELTESLLLEPGLDGVGALLERLAGLGVQVAIDDFGTGCSSLMHLKRLPVHRIKIDRAFVSGIGAEADSEAIVRATVGLAHGLARQVVAEGVETEAQHAFLARLGCHEAQGYLYGAAAEARAVAALARQAR